MDEGFRLEMHHPLLACVHQPSAGHLNALFGANCLLLRAVSNHPHMLDF
jgi:hypothetical protein